MIAVTFTLNPSGLHRCTIVAGGRTVIKSGMTLEGAASAALGQARHERIADGHALRNKVVEALDRARAEQGVT